MHGSHGTKIHLVCIQAYDLQGDSSLVIVSSSCGAGCRCILMYKSQCWASSLQSLAYYPSRSDSHLLASGRAAFQNQLPKYSDLIRENGEEWSMACPTSPLAVDGVPNTAARMWPEERSRKQEESPRREESLVLFKVLSHIIPHVILTSFCIQAGKV